MASASFIDLNTNFPGLVGKIKGYTGVAIWCVDDDAIPSIILLLETDEGFEWSEISACEKIGAVRKDNVVQLVKKTD